MKAWFRKTKRKHWTVLATVLGGGEILLPLFQDAIPRGVFAVLCLLAYWGSVKACELEAARDA